MESESLIDFSWSVVESGYSVVETDGASTPRKKRYFLTCGIPWGYPITERFYCPIEDPSSMRLVRTFSGLHFTHTAICEFANQFGLLGLPSTIISLPKPHAPRVDGKLTLLAGNGEPVDDWFAEIEEIRQALNTWDAVMRADIASLASWIKWRSDRRVDFENRESGGRRIIAAELGGGETPHLVNPRALAHFRSYQSDVNRLREPARYWIQTIINEKLTQHAAPRLLWERNFSRLGLHVSPKNLLGAMWLQFARAVARNKSDLKRCDFCNEYFQRVAHGKFCKDACKQAAYRARKKNGNGAGSSERSSVRRARRAKKPSRSDAAVRN